MKTNEIWQNFDVISMNDVVEIYGQGKGWPKTAAVTFDDGFQNNYTNAVSFRKV